MKMGIYSIYDSAANYYSQPFFQKTEQEAVRSFRQVINDTSTQPGQNPEDFSLFFLGMFDPIDGDVMGANAPEKVTSGVAVKDNELLQPEQAA